jgi:hypothetical protein
MLFSVCQLRNSFAAAVAFEAECMLLSAACVGVSI